MTSPGRATDESGLVAVIDETTPADAGGIYYVVSSAVVLDVDSVRSALASSRPADRTRPFHWVDEGSHARDAMVDLICSTGTIAQVTVCYTTGRRRQEQARRLALAELVPMIALEGAREIVIESRSRREDARDRETLIEATRGLAGTLTYRWETKAEPILWIADAVCGVVKEYLLGDDTTAFERLQAGAVIKQILFRQLPHSRYE